jgi:hypothetical protein
MQYDSIFVCVKIFAPVAIHHQMAEVYGARAMSWKQVWVFCRSFDNGRLAVVDK